MSAAADAPRRRVLALIDTASVSGPGRQLAALAVALRGEGVTLRVALFHRVGRPVPAYVAYLAAAGVDHVVVPERGPADRAALAAVRALIAGWRPDVVQTHSYKTTAMAWLLRRGGARWPWIAFFHGATTEDWKVRAYHWLDARLMPAADRLVVMTRAHLPRFAAAGDRAQVLYNAAIPLPADGPPTSVAAHRRPGAPLVGVVGRLSSEKGVDVFLDALAALARRGVAVDAVLAGDGPERAALERQRDALGLADRVHFLGPVRDVASLYPQLDLVVLPSRSEGLPNVLLEALRADVPVVATRVGAVPEVLDDAPLAGLTVPPTDAAALAGAIVRALPLGADPAARAARAVVAGRFSLERRVQAHLALYDAVDPRPAMAPRAPAAPAGVA